MINPSFKELEKVSNSRYAICVMASKRARKLINGSEPLIKTKDKNPITIAIEEIMEDKVYLEKEKNE